MANTIVIQGFEFASNTIRKDEMVNATALTTAYKNKTGKRKDSRDWLLTKEAKESIAYLERATGIPVSALVIVENGVGTWMHPDLAEIFSQWVSVEYRFAVVKLIQQAKEQQQVQPEKVLTRRDAVEYIEAAKTLSQLVDPLMRSLLSQRMYEELQGQQALPGASERLVAVAVRAGELGFRLGQGEDSALGKYIKARFQPEGQIPHGRYEVYAYKLTPMLDEAIRSFFYALQGEN